MYKYIILLYFALTCCNSPPAAPLANIEINASVSSDLYKECCGDDCWVYLEHSQYIFVE